ncbi:MAG: ribosome-associated translation inhibitor RaiA [Sphingobacteriia bacterium]|jgi:putative sigma-54 modulation protein|nr:ribosome-associated translation inhibitor RaiA [Paludibacteraceae bacterium]NCA78873.1 ribosome-associated translation inhibitor RaiA [Sphingobacteriia bacterium]
MEIKMQAIKFDASDKLEAYVEKKVSKIEKLFDQILTAEVYLKIVKPETADNKEASIKLIAPNVNFFASKVADSFEQAIDECIDALERQIQKQKSRK